MTSTETDHGREEDQIEGQAQVRVSCAAPGTLPGGAQRIEAEDPSADHPGSPDRAGKPSEGIRDESGWGDTGVTYRPIPSRPGYFAGSDGSIWSHKRNPPIKRKPGLTGKGGSRAYICFSTGDMIQVPHLVLEAFIGPRPEGKECCHDNGNPIDNRIVNLRWDTHASNMQDKSRHGTETVGERHPRSSMTDAIVRKIIALSETIPVQAEIARQLGLSMSAVHKVLAGYTWTHVTGLSRKKSGNKK